MNYEKINALPVCPALKEYLFGRMETGVLLLGQKGMDNMVKDAVLSASFILNSEKPELSPDYMFVGLDSEKSIGVERADEIVDRAMFRPAMAERTVIVIDNMDKMTVPAQNKLLKLLEDSETSVVIGIAYEDTLLATVKSRMQIVSYAPLDLVSFMEHCEKNGVSDGEVQYFLSGGMTENIKKDSPVVNVFKNVGADIKDRRFSSLLKSLNLLKEKDKDSFFLSNREYVPSLISFMGQTFTDNLKGEKDHELITLCGEHRERCESVSYTKDDFFDLIAQIIWKGDSVL